MRRVGSCAVALWMSLVVPVTSQEAARQTVAPDPAASVAQQTEPPEPVLKVRPPAKASVAEKTEPPDPVLKERPPHALAVDEAKDSGPTLAHTCLITNDTKRLADFYEAVLEVKAKWSGPDYVEFTTGSNTLAIFSFSAQQQYIPGSAEAAMNRSMILEFRVEDPDREYDRLRSIVKNWVKPPSTQPWGTRSIYFRDPDGNLVDFFTVMGKS
jgi:catechol 2,3-dioxygenase-like lactoylglutathione lyase family enzyme